jgi:hypothetical protein
MLNPYLHIIIFKYYQDLYLKLLIITNYLLPTSTTRPPTSQRSRGPETLKDESEIETQMMIRENFGKSPDFETNLYPLG